MIKLTTLAVLMGTLAGCSSMVEKIDTNINRDADKIASTYSQAMEKVAPPKNNFKQSKEIWINPTPLPTYIVNKKPLPDLFKNRVEITMPQAVPVNEIVTELTREFSERYKRQLNIDVSQDVYNPNGGVGTVLSNTLPSAAPGQAAPVNAAANQQTINGLNSNQINNVLVDAFVFQGTLESALNMLAQKTGTSWEWNGSSVEMYRFKVKNYYISALSNSISSKSTISSASQSTNTNSNSGGGGGGGGNATIEGGSSGGGGSTSSTTGQTLTSESKIDQIQEITTYIRSMLSPSGRLSIMESTGIVTVRDTPLVQENIDKAIRELNAVLSKQIHVNLEVYAVEVNEGDNLGLDWNLIWSAAGNKYNFAYKSLTNTTGLSAANIGVVNGNFSGSNILLGLNSKIGRVVNGTSGTIVTQNGKITPIILATTREYIRAITTSVTSNGATSTPTYSATPATATTGLDAKVQARIQPDGRILLKLNMNLSELKSLTTFQIGQGVNASTVQLADTDLKNIEQEITLRSAQSLVLSGFKQYKNIKNNSGTGNPYNILLGGGSREASSKDVQLVIIATPYYIENND